jgi:alpha/beta hydrolase family protein
VILPCMARFVLVHGAWHGGWCFERLTGELERRGHEVSAPDLPCDRPGLTVHDYAAAAGGGPDAVVVGHSLGGLTIPFVPARMTVFLAALVPSQAVFLGLHPEFVGVVRDELDRSYWPDVETAHERLYPDLDAEDAAWAFERLRRQTRLGPVVELPPGPRASIVTTRDRAVRPEWQAAAAREILGVEPIELDSGHSPFITHPRELADLLESLA